MKSYPMRIKAAWLVVMIALVACNYPVSPPSATFAPTPDSTMTAIYAVINTATALAAPPVQPPASATVAAAGPTQAVPTQPLPTATGAPPTSVPPTSVPPTNVPPTNVPPTSVPPTRVPATATTRPTSTPVSLVGPGARSAPKLVARYLQREPNIDGVFDEWDQDRYPVASVVYGGGSRKNEADLSATVMLGWDDYYLYIAVRVKDDAFVQNATGEQLFRGDSLEVLLDTEVSKDFHLDELSKDDFQLGLSPGKGAGSAGAGTDGTGTDGASTEGAPESYLWYPKAKAGAYGEVKIAATLTDNGYRIEAKIPWSLYGVTAPDIGRHFGFVFSVSDNDKSGENVQQSMVSTSPGRTLTDPTTWGDLELRGAK